MVKHNQSPTQHHQFLKVGGKPSKGPVIEITDLGDENDRRILLHGNKNGNKRTSSEMLSTGELLSAVGQIWDGTNRSLARFRPRRGRGPDYSDAVRPQGYEKWYLAENVDIVALNMKDSGYLCFDLDLCRHYPCIVQQSLNRMRLTQVTNYMPFEAHKIENFISKNLDDSRARNYSWFKEDGRMNTNEWVSNPPWEHLMSTSTETPKIIQSFMSEAAVSKFKDLFSGGRCLDLVKRRLVASSLYLEYILQNVKNHHTTSMSTASSLKMKLFTSIPEPGCCCEATDHQLEADEMVENQTAQCNNTKTEAEFQSKSSSLVMNKPHPLLAKQEHAFSGALAGIFVSLCLHPIDTVKTVVQTCQAGPKSLCCIGQSIISERGLFGLYRGVSSKLTTSAPISALYTFTYESVKGSLLPSMAKEYHSIVHCAAGGCASIATSFIFTPSEHIKQQMQVNSKYLSCWSAASRIVEKGGLLSLYTGWGAVLCRNIPHSIIKFYTYESLKQLLMSSEQPSRQPNTLQTLLCGGLAGSAATLFSTPFDVVKTRLQTQTPGSARKYHNILNALHHIRKHEGIGGLYRGLVPRLVMYMSQGALFFASYEFFKSVLPLELSQDNVTDVAA